MSTTIKDLEQKLGRTFSGPIKWNDGKALPKKTPDVLGIYVVSRVSSKDGAVEAGHPLTNAGLSRFSLPAIDDWIKAAPSMMLHGQKPSAQEIAEYLDQFWDEDEPILYIGKAGTSLHTRVKQFFGHHLGKRGPHAGGHWLLTLNNSDSIVVWWAECDDKEQAAACECTALKTFAAAQVAPNELPFANRDGRCVRLPRSKSPKLAPQTKRKNSPS